MHAKQIAIIGCGIRTDCYLDPLLTLLDKEWTLRAVADPKSHARRVYQERYGHGRAAEFQEGPELLDHLSGQLDVVIIGSPNALHLESALPAFDQGLTVLLEKPVATTVEDCETLWRSWRKANSPPVLVGFVLRYTPFYRTVKDIINSGQIGRILSIEGAEWLNVPMTAGYTRGWRRKSDLCGSFLLEKCCHDMDIFNYLINAQPLRVVSFAHRSRFGPKRLAATHCNHCALSAECRYEVSRVDAYHRSNLSGNRQYLSALLPLGDDLCVFKSQMDINDHQVVSLEYPGGITASFTVVMDQPKTTRTLTIFGTDGIIRGDFASDHITLLHHTEAGQEPSREDIMIHHDSSGHGGGDSLIAEQFRRLFRSETFIPLAGLREGIEAALVSFAADRSVEEKRVVEISEVQFDYFKK